MDIARLKERITIEKLTVKVDEIGNHTNGWEDYYSCYAYANTYMVDESVGKVDYENQTIARIAHTEGEEQHEEDADERRRVETVIGRASVHVGEHLEH